MSTEKPQFDHDCDKCVFVGRFPDPYGQSIFDGYVSEHEPWKSVIIRFGGGGEYTSIPVSTLEMLKNHPAVQVFFSILEKYEEIKGK
jgi:hypothetical protein